MLAQSVEWADVLAKTDSGVFALYFEIYGDNDDPTYERREVSIADGVGDFDGDGRVENAYIEKDADYEHSIVFSGEKFPPIVLGNLAGSEPSISNRGDSDGKPGDEITVDYPLMMNQAMTRIFRFDGKEWKQISGSVSGPPVDSIEPDTAL